VVHGRPNETVPDSIRLGTARVALLGTGFVTAWLAIAAPGDPLQLFLWSLSFTAGAAFPVLLLSIWWERTNAWGALSGMTTGFTVAAVTMLLSETGAIDMPSALAGAIGFPCALVAAFAISLSTAAPPESVVDLVNEVRVPGGETIHDREMRLLRLRNRTPT
jgi:cation/acetate symporter